MSTPPPAENRPGGSGASGEPEPASPGDHPENPFSTGGWVNYTGTALLGDPDLIRSRGGTLLPDDEEASCIIINGVMYKKYLDKNGRTRPEYAVGNPRFMQERYLRDGGLSPLEGLTNGVYPENESGESYGDDILADYAGYAPDLILFNGENGSTGYFRESDQSAILEHNADRCLGHYSIPLYASDGKTVIGAYTMICCRF